MIDVIFSRRAQVPRERNASLIPDDYRPRQLRAADGGDYEALENQRFVDGPPINLDKLENELNRDRLKEIAILVRSLTYGEMMELTQAIWNVRPEGVIDQQSLPMRLHLWSKSVQLDGGPSGGKILGAEAAE
jgi:hypothetical protein